MPEQGGLYGGLTFKDLLFPAAGAIASAYNPYIGYGLQTGMNMFNSFASFQNDLKHWKQQREEQEQLLAAKDDLRRGAKEFITFREGRLGEAEEVAADAAKRQMGQDIINRPPAVDMPTAPWMPGVSARDAVAGMVGGATPNPTLGEIFPNYDQDIRSALIRDQDVIAEREALAGSRLGQSEIAASPGSAAQMLGLLSTRAHDAARERGRFNEAWKKTEESRQNEFLNKQALKNQELAGRLQLIQEGEASQIREYGAYAETVRALGYDNTPTNDMPAFKLQEELVDIHKALTNSAKAEALSEKAGVDLAVTTRALTRRAREIEKELLRREKEDGLKVNWEALGNPEDLALLGYDTETGDVPGVAFQTDFSDENVDLKPGDPLFGHFGIEPNVPKQPPF
jgi:hypothetical protein